MTTKQISLTPRQLEVLQIVREYQKNRCYSITLQELACQMGLSRTTVFGHVGALKEKDLLLANAGRARSLKLTPQALRLLELSQVHKNEKSGDETGEVPLLGRIAAGVPIDAIENPEKISLNSEFGGSDDVFALTVCGDSMCEDGILDGDVVICRYKNTAATGEIVVAIVEEDTATLKRFYPEQDRVRLESANKNYQPIYTDNCRITGVVVGLIRKIGR